MFDKSKNIYALICNNQVASRFTKVFSVDILVKGSTFLLLPVYLHLMTQNEVGVFNYLYAFVQTISVLLSFGLYTAQSKLYHDYTENKRKELLFSINFIFISFLIVVLVPIYIFGLDFKAINFLFDHPIPYHLYRFPLLLAFISSAGSFMLFNFLLTSENIKRVQMYNLFRLFLSNGVVIAILYFSKGDKVFTRLCSYYLCETLLWLLFSISYVKEFKFAFSSKLIKVILSYSLPIFLLAILATVQGFSDKFFIQQKTDMSVMAVYTLGVTIASVCSLIIMSFQNIWLPIFLKEKNVEANFKRTQKMIKIIVVIFFIIALLMIASVKIALIFNIIPVIYEKVIVILPFLFLSQILLAVNAMFGNYFLYFGKMKLGSITGGCVYIISFVLNFWLIPRYGVNGAIIALLLGNIILLITVYAVVKRLYRKNKNLKHEPVDHTIVVPE